MVSARRLVQRRFSNAVDLVSTSNHEPPPPHTKEEQEPPTYVDEAEPPAYGDEAVVHNFASVDPLSIQATFQELSGSSGSFRTMRKHSWPHEYRQTGPAAPAEVSVVLIKATEETPFGIRLESNGQRAVVQFVQADGPAAGLIAPFDSIVEIDGSRLCTDQPAELALKLMCAAEAGVVKMRKLPPAEELVHGARVLQDRWRTIHARTHGLRRCVVFKTDPLMKLGLSFAAEDEHPVISDLVPGSAAARVFCVGDTITRVNGVACEAPVETARRMRQASGLVDCEVMPRSELSI